MKVTLNKKTIIALCSFMILAFCLLTIAFSTNAHALDDRIDIYLEEPVIVMQGEQITQSDLTTSFT